MARPDLQQRSTREPTDVTPMGHAGPPPCPGTADGHHQIDPSTIRPGDGGVGVLDDDGTVAISVECSACGACGDAELSSSAIAWDDP